MDNITLGLNRGELIYDQIYRFLKEEILGGRIKCDERLPSKRSLATQLGVSVNTVDTAYGMLMAEGYITSKERSGFFACNVASEQIIMPAKPTRDYNKNQQSVLYNFTTSSIDSSLFPFKLWCRIEREVLGDEQLLNHGKRQGDYNLRSAICSYLKAYRGFECRPEEIVVGAGIDYLLSLTARLFEDSCVAVENPGYGRAERVFRDFGTFTEYIPLDKNGMSYQELKKSDAQLAYLTPSCQFPTGIIMPVSRRQEILSWANEDESRYIIEDDYNSEFRFSTRPIPALKSLDSAGKVVHIGTFSKSVAPSLRVAYMVLPQSLLARWEERFSVYACTVSRFEQQALCRFIEGGHFSRHINRLRIACKKRRESLVSALKENFKDSVEVTAADTGLHVIADFKVGLSEQEIINRAKEVQISIISMNEYCHGEHKKYDCRFILGFSAMNEQQIKKAVTILKEAIL